jgi:hypothetical protein
MGYGWGSRHVSSPIDRYFFLYLLFTYTNIFICRKTPPHPDTSQSTSTRQNRASNTSSTSSTSIISTRTTSTYTAEGPGLETSVSQALRGTFFFTFFFSYYTNDLFTGKYTLHTSYNPRTTPAPTCIEARNGGSSICTPSRFKRGLRMVTTTQPPPKTGHY